MATYVVGDVQGCMEPLDRLLGVLPLRPQDEVWLAGDLVNRGPSSLEVLRWASRDARVRAVLGNHDLYALGCFWGLWEPRSKDTLQDLLGAPDAGQLFAWLAERPLCAQQGGWLVVHAGLHPGWTVPEAVALGHELHQQIRADAAPWLRMYHSKEALPPWRADMRGPARYAVLASIFTRIRTCDATGDTMSRFSGHPDDAPPGFRPWFEWPNPRDATTVVFGHWAALGYYTAPGIIALDSGCVWGNRLTAVRLEDQQAFSVPAAEVS